MSISGVLNSIAQPFVALSHLDELLAAKKYREASLELILKLQTESPENENVLSSICQDYRLILNEGELEQSEIKNLRQNFLKFLKRILPNCPLAQRELLQEVNALRSSPNIKWNLPSQVEAYLFLYTLCPSQEKEICHILLDILKQAKLLQEPIHLKNLEELESLLSSANISLGDSFICLRSFLLKAISTSSIDAAKAKEILDGVLKENGPVYFPEIFKKNLDDFRGRFEKNIQYFLQNPLQNINPKEVRQFQRDSCKNFHENVLLRTLSFPLKILDHKKIQAELHVYGSIAREELVPFSDLEAIFLLEEDDRLEPNGRFLGSIIEWIGIQVTALGESQTLPEELSPLIDKMPLKGLSLESTPNLAVLPLRTLNASLPICMTTASTLCQFQRERRLIEKLKKELEIVVRTSDKRRKDSIERRLKQILAEISRSETQKELFILLEQLNPREILEQFKEYLRELKRHVCEKSAPIALAELKQLLKTFEKQNQQNLEYPLRRGNVL